MEDGKKKCTKCGEVKSLMEFSKCKVAKDGRAYKCKTCSNKSNLTYIRTKKGLVGAIYRDQTKNSKVRNHPKPEYSTEWLREWVYNQPNFELLFNNWVSSGYEKKMRPSIDRKDDSVGYTKDNIQLMTWQENLNKSRRDVRSGKLAVTTKPHKPVIQLTKDEKYVNEFVSASQAGRETGIGRQNISSTCGGIRNYAGGYKWKFKD